MKVFCLCVALLVATQAQAQPQPPQLISSTNAVRLELDNHGTVWAVNPNPRRHLTWLLGDYAKLRLSKPGQAAKLFFSGHRVYILDKNQTIWQLDTSQLMMFLTKLKWSVADGATMGFATAGVWLLLQSSGFDLPHSLSSTIFLLGSIVTASDLLIARPASLLTRIGNGANFFKIKVASKVQSVEYDETKNEFEIIRDHHLPQPMSQIFSHLKRDCQDWLTKLF